MEAGFKLRTTYLDITETGSQQLKLLGKNNSNHLTIVLTLSVKQNIC